MIDYQLHDVQSDADYEFVAELLSANYGEKLGIEYDVNNAREFAITKEDPFARSLIASIDDNPHALIRFRHFPKDNGVKLFAIDVLTMPAYRSDDGWNTLYQEVVTRVKEHHPDELQSFSFDFMDDNIRCLENAGFHVIQRDQNSTLELEHFNFSDFSDIIDRLEANGIQLISLPEYQEREPDYLRKIADLVNTINKDIPGFENNIYTIDHFENEYFNSGTAIPEAWVLALDGDQLVGISWVTRFSDKFVITNLTGVIRSHRRRGITTAMKIKVFEIVANMGYREVITSNEENNPMYQINVKLGFQPATAILHYAKKLK